MPAPAPAGLRWLLTPARAAQGADLLTRRRIAGLRFGAGALIAFGVLEFGVLGVRSISPMAVRVAWAGSALLVAWGLTYPGARRHAALLSLLAGVSPVFYAALLWHRGGTSGVPFAFFLATPLVFAVVLRGEVVPAMKPAQASARGSRTAPRRSTAGLD